MWICAGHKRRYIYACKWGHLSLTATYSLWPSQRAIGGNCDSRDEPAETARTVLHSWCFFLCLIETCHIILYKYDDDNTQLVNKNIYWIYRKYIFNIIYIVQVNKVFTLQSSYVIIMLCWLGRQHGVYVTHNIKLPKLFKFLCKFRTANNCLTVVIT